MRIVRTLDELQAWRCVCRGSVGFVPTMGYLHDGHGELIKAAVDENDHSIVSIFVNPSQFNESSDFEEYPRDEEADLARCRDLGIQAVFLPSAETLYPEGFDTWINVERLTQRLEGEFRPGHFRGVATVVYLLFQLVRPTRAYFGEKDAQQLLVVRKMAHDLHLRVNVIGKPTVREKDGLAMSSRNARLTARQREAAPALYAALKSAEERIAAGETRCDTIIGEMRKLILDRGPFKIDYISIADTGTLAELKEVSFPCLISLAAFLGDVRLIDNIILS